MEQEQNTSCKQIAQTLRTLKAERLREAYDRLVDHILTTRTEEELIRIEKMMHK